MDFKHLQNISLAFTSSHLWLLWSFKGGTTDGYHTLGADCWFNKKLFQAQGKKNLLYSQVLAESNCTTTSCQGASSANLPVPEHLQSSHPWPGAGWHQEILQVVERHININDQTPPRDAQNTMTTLHPHSFSRVVWAQHRGDTAWRRHHRGVGTVQLVWHSQVLLSLRNGWLSVLFRCTERCHPCDK